MQNPELKKVLPYIPYGVQAQDEHGNLRTVTIDHQSYDQNTVGINHVLCNGLFFKRHTLVLRPLSDLTKEIEHNGEKFVPRDTRVLGKFEISINPEFNFFDGLGSNNNINDLPYFAIQKLLEWHFEFDIQKKT